MEYLTNTIHTLNQWVWGPPLLVLVILVGIYTMIRTRGIQFRYFFYSHKLAFVQDDKIQSSEGDLSHFQSLMTALAATIGIGSIAGVATAMVIGGLGSLFWMWMAGILGAGIKYAEAVLAIRYRIVDHAGRSAGGPMYYLEKGVKSKPLASAFAAFGALTALGTGNLIQSNSVATAMSALMPISPIWVGILLCLSAGWPLLRGIQTIGKIVSIIVPLMAIFYILGCLGVIFVHASSIPTVIKTVFQQAFTFQGTTGGIVGSTLLLTMQAGISRGIFSSEAGLGSASIAAATAKTDVPSRQALISMSSVFMTTGIICTLTGMAIATSGLLGTSDVNGVLLDGSTLVVTAFTKAIPYGGVIVAIALVPFAYSTLLGWAYYGEKCTEYLLGNRSILGYRLLFISCIFLGTTLEMKLAWGLANLMNGLMAFPNLIGLALLMGTVAKETTNFGVLFRKERLGKITQTT